ncbi:MAG: radical SAM protein [Bryobacterales bacterium]|nr:radical SAM protein [Bryobacterales bacterium]
MLPHWDAAYRRVHDGINYRLRSLAGGRFASLCRPASIILLLTEHCNARCVHCDIWKNRGREDSPSVEQWKTLLSDIRRWLGPAQVALSGGEALLKPWAPEMVRHGVRAGLAMEILTHGFWDDLSRIEETARARPLRITISVDGIGDTHTLIRGRERFWEKTLRTIKTLVRLRKSEDLGYAIRLKTVIMRQNLNDLASVARFAAAHGLDAFYQPVEQNYNTPEDPRWWEHSENWPDDPGRAIEAVNELIRLKSAGFPVANSPAQLDAMARYFRDPESSRVSVQGHSAHERRLHCTALTMLQIQADGGVTVCAGMPVVGNIRHAPIDEIWRNRPRWWQEGCCLTRRCSDAEKQAFQLIR